MYPRNAASPPRLAIGAVVQISDGAVQTSGVSIKVRPEGGAASAGGGTTAYEEGIVLYTPTQAETNYTAFVVIAYKTGCVPVSLAVVTTASDTAGKVDVGAFGGTSVTGRDIGASVLLSSGTGTGQISLSSGTVTTGALSSGAITAASLAADVQARLGIVAYGTAQAATGTTIQLASASTFADDELNGSVVVITGGTTGVGQSRVITDYASSTDTATVDTWTTTPSGTITYVVFAAPPASATVLPAVNVTQFGGAAGTFASGRPEVSPADGSIAAATFAAGAITATVIATGALDADALAADAVTEIAAGVLVAAASTPIDANVQEINDVAITGDGSATPFNVV